MNTIIIYNFILLKEFIISISKHKRISKNKIKETFKSLSQGGFLPWVFPSPIINWIKLQNLLQQVLSWSCSTSSSTQGCKQYWQYNPSHIGHLWLVGSTKTSYPQHIGHLTIFSPSFSLSFFHCLNAGSFVTSSLLKDVLK